MPRGDGTGPMGMGPRTGRAMGYCGGYASPGWANPGPGRGFFGRGAWSGGGGRGWRNWYYATGLPRWARFGGPVQGVAPAWGYGEPYVASSPEQEIDMLKEQAEWLKAQLESINRRMDELAKE